MGESGAANLSACAGGVCVSPAAAADVGPYRLAMEASAQRIGVWNPVNPNDLVHHLAAQSDSHRTFLIRADSPQESRPLVGCVNVSNVVRGRFMSATMGYNAFDPYVGTGLFAQGLKLVVGLALREAPGGMGLHRVEANVRIGNNASAGVLRSLGFRRERTVRRMLWLADGLGGPSAWRDHDSYAITRDEWPSIPYGPQNLSAGVLVVGACHRQLVQALALELGAVPLVDVPYGHALDIAAMAGAPVIWMAQADAAQAVSDLKQRGVPAAQVDSEFKTADTVEAEGAPEFTARTVTRLALALRPYFI